MRINFPGEFKSHYPTDELVSGFAQSLSDEMRGYTRSQVDAGIKKSLKLKYLPKPSEFGECLKPSWADFGFPSPVDALQQLRNWRASRGFCVAVQHKLPAVIYTTYLRLDPFLWVRMDAKQSSQAFEKAYTEVVADFANGIPLKEQLVELASESVVKQEFKPGEVDSIRDSLRAKVGLR